MFATSPAAWLALISVFTTGAATAQAVAPDSSVSAAAAAAAAASATAGPALGYQSAFEGYQPYQDEKSVSWQAANEIAYQRGGWRAYAKAAASVDPGTADSPAAGSMQGGGHSMHMHMGKPMEDKQPKGAP